MLVSAAMLAMAGAGAAAAYETAHKEVTLDVDGAVTSVVTFQGDVGDLLADEGITLTERDVVTPAAGETLRDGGTVVVRYAHEVTLRADGKQRTEWIAELDADRTLASLTLDSADVVLLPQRTDGRTVLPMRLDVDGPVSLVVGGKARQVDDGDVRLDELLAAQDVTVDADDRVTVKHVAAKDEDTAPVVTVVVKDVQTSIEQSTKEVPFETVTALDPDHYKDQAPYVATYGVPGERVTSWDITRIDGKEVERDKLSSAMSTWPVDEVVMYGTKERPKPKPDPEPKSDSKGGSKSDAKSDAKNDAKNDSKNDSKKGSSSDSAKNSKGESESSSDSKGGGSSSGTTDQKGEGSESKKESKGQVRSPGSTDGEGSAAGLRVELGSR